MSSGSLLKSVYKKWTMASEALIGEVWTLKGYVLYYIGHKRLLFVRSVMLSIVITDLRHTLTCFMLHKYLPIAIMFKILLFFCN